MRARKESEDDDRVIMDRMDKEKELKFVRNTRERKEKVIANY
jgi:hypothetical protein